MGLVKWDPIKDLVFLQERMSRIFDDALLKYRGPESGTPAWSPQADIYETADSVIIKAEVPGIAIRAIDIEVHEDRLTLSGERRLNKNLAEENCQRMERCYGPFKRVFKLPNAVDKDRIKANLKDGVLEIVLPRIIPGKNGVRVRVE